MKFVNLTPHPVTINGETIPSSGMVRLSETTITIDNVDGIDLVTKHFGEAEGLPDPQEDVMYIVSGLVRLALPERRDVASPGDAVRDESGRIVGVTNLVVNRLINPVPGGYPGREAIR